MLYVYIGCFTFGVLYSIVSAIFGSHGFDHGGIDHGGIGHTGLDLSEGGGGANSHATGGDADMPSPLNPTVLFSSLAAFGAVGLIGKLGFSMSDLPSALMALACAGIVGAAMFFGVIKLIYGSQSNTGFSLNDTIGLDAEVNIPIPAEGLGEIVCIINGMRHTMSAKSRDAAGISQGETVRIKEIAGNVAIVGRKINASEYDFNEIDEIDEIDEIQKKKNKGKENI